MITLPNWSSNAIVTTNPTIIAALVQAQEQDKGILGLLYPMPVELQGISSGGCTDIHGRYVRLWRDTPDGAVGLTDDEIRDYKRRFGTADWYDWCVNAWGTKWDTHISSLEIIEIGDIREARATFDTAWGPPGEWLERIINDHPEGVTTLSYAEGGMGFFGTVTYRDGEVVDGWHNETDFWGETQDEDGWSLPSPACQEHLDRYGLHVGG